MAPSSEHSTSAEVSLVLNGAGKSFFWIAKDVLINTAWYVIGFSFPPLPPTFLCGVGCWVLVLVFLCGEVVVFCFVCLLLCLFCNKSTLLAHIQPMVQFNPWPFSPVLQLSQPFSSLYCSCDYSGVTARLCTCLTDFHFKLRRLPFSALTKNVSHLKVCLTFIPFM